MRLCRKGIFLIALAALAANAAVAAVFVSDDFSDANLDTQIWTVQDPIGGAGFLIASNELAISIAGGTEHNIWTDGNNSARVMQPTDNVDFEIEIKFASLPTQQYQMQGLLIEQDSGNFLRFDFYSDGVNLRSFAASFENGSPSVIYDNLIIPGSALYMRVSRVGNQWSQSYSVNGVIWTNSLAFSRVLSVSSVGPFVGNAGAGSTPAFTGLIDYFFNTASPIDPEDGGVTGPDTTPPFIYNELVSAVSDTEIAVSWNTDELADGVVEYGLTTAYELGPVSDAALTTGHAFALTNLQADTTYQVRVSSTDASGNVSSSQNHAIFTSALPVFDIWYGNNQTFGAVAKEQAWINILGNVSDPDGITSLTYSLNGQPATPLTVGPDGVRLQALGDFNADISFDDLIVGQNTIVITAQDSQGFESTEIVVVDYQGETHQPLDYSVDWSTVANVQDVSMVVDGLWTLEADAVRPLELGYDRLIAIGDVQWQNYEITVPITVHGLDPLCSIEWCAGGGPLVGVLVRWPGHYDFTGAQPFAGWFPMGTLGGFKWMSGDAWLELYRGSDGKVVQEDHTATMPFEVPHIFKVRAETTGGVHRYRVKMWPESDAEPATWNFTIDEALTEIDSGSVLLVAHHVDASFGEVVVTSLDDFVAPTISNIQVLKTKTSATITWQTDENASSAVDAGWTTAYEFGTQSDAVLKTSHSITLTGLSAGATYHYQISSVDGSGNAVTSADLTFTTTVNTGYVCGACHE